MSQTNTLAYFNSQVCEFRNLMGQKTFWASERKKELAVKAITHLYFNITLSDAEEKQMMITYESTMLEYTRRETLVFLHSPRKADAA